MLTLIILSSQSCSSDDDPERCYFFRYLNSLSNFNVVFSFNKFLRGVVSFHVVRFCTFMPRYCFRPQGLQNSNFEPKDKSFLQVFDLFIIKYSGINIVTHFSQALQEASHGTP